MVKRFQNIPNAWKFFLVVIVLFYGIAVIFPDIARESLINSWLLLKQMYVSLILVFIFTYLFNVLITDKVIKQYLQNDIGLKKYLIVGIIGIFSTGPIYMWFSYLSSMKKEGMNNGLISMFLYNRAIKLPLLPLMIQYFPQCFVKRNPRSPRLQ